MLFPAQLPSPVVQENTTLQDQVSPGQPGASGLVSPLPQGTSISGKDRALAQVQSQLAEVSRDSDFCWGESTEQHFFTFSNILTFTMCLCHLIEISQNVLLLLSCISYSTLTLIVLILTSQLNRLIYIFK